MIRPERASIVIGFIIITLIWSSTWFAIKLGLETVPPLFGVAMRFTAATVLFVLLLIGRREKFVFDRTTIPLYCVIGLFSFSVPFGLVYIGEQYIPSGLASILYAIYPFVVAIGSHLLLPAERLNRYKITGIVTGFIGLLIIFWSDLRVENGSAFGIGCIVLSASISALSLVVAKRMGKHVSPVAMNVGGMIFGLPVLYLLAFATESIASVHPDAKGWWSILYLGSFGTVVTFTIYYWLLKHVEAVYLSLITMITPVLAIILGAVFLQEVFSVRTLVGSAFVLLGVLITYSREIARSVQQTSPDVVEIP